MTKLSSPVTRETAKTYSARAVIITIAPAGSQAEALIGLRLKGTRTEYVVALSDLFRMAALWHGQKEAAAKLLNHRPLKRGRKPIKKRPPAP